jgi:hypothetical protein
MALAASCGRCWAAWACQANAGAAVARSYAPSGDASDVGLRVTGADSFSSHKTAIPIDGHSQYNTSITIIAITSSSTKVSGFITNSVGSLATRSVASAAPRDLPPDLPAPRQRLPFGDTRELLAVTIANIYRSEQGNRPDLRTNHQPLSQWVDSKEFYLLFRGGGSPW